LHGGGFLHFYLLPDIGMIGCIINAKETGAFACLTYYIIA